MYVNVCKKFDKVYFSLLYFFEYFCQPRFKIKFDFLSRKFLFWRMSLETFKNIFKNSKNSASGSEKLLPRLLLSTPFVKESKKSTSEKFEKSRFNISRGGLLTGETLFLCIIIKTGL